LPIFIPPVSPQSPSPVIRGWYNRPVVAAVPKVPPHKLTKKLKNRKHKERKHTTKRTSGKHMKAEPEKKEWENFNKNFIYRILRI
jgi:hypothetical protein